MSDEKIIRAFPAKELPECPVAFEERRHAFSYCQHPLININTHDRLITCAKCGATLDPFDYVAAEARAIRRGWDDYRQIQALLSERRQQIADLDRERKRLQGQVRRLNLRNKD